MAARRTLEDRLAALRDEVTRAPDSPGATASLRRALESSTALLVSLAAKLVAEHGLVALADALAAPLVRLLDAPVKSDPSCHAKLALVEALRVVGGACRGDAIAALRRVRGHVQSEPAWGPPVDTAPPLRGAAALALVELGVPDVVNELVELLADPEPVARAHAVQALAGCGEPGVEALLRLKLRLGDADPSVLAGCLEVLLELWPERSVDFAIACLQRAATDPTTAEHAALALGQARCAAALPALVAHADCADVTLRTSALVALGLLRHADATDYLLGVLANDLERDALAALDALAIQAHDDTLRRRVERLVTARASARLAERFAERFEHP